MSGETYQVYVGGECVVNKLVKQQALEKYWQLCNSYPEKPIYFAQVTVLSTNQAAKAALQQ